MSGIGESPNVCLRRELGYANRALSIHGSYSQGRARITLRELGTSGDEAKYQRQGNACRQITGRACSEVEKLAILPACTQADSGARFCVDV